MEIIFGEIEEIDFAKEFFDARPSDLEQIVDLVRKSFGRELSYEDIYTHVTNPEKVYLVRTNKQIVGMASFNRKLLSGLPSRILEGIAIEPEFQGYGVFRNVMEFVCNNDSIICLRTQSPRMYRALEKYCSYTYPSKKEIPEAIKAIRKDFADYLGCEIDSKGIVRGYYGGLFYGEEPKHKKISSFFNEIGLDLNKGDALLVVGIK